MCGIFGQQAKKGKKINLLKNRILGLYNRERGIHSAGIWWDGNLQKGIDANKDFYDWAAKVAFKPGNIPAGYFMGHTRKATNGVHDLINAHPHLIDDEYVQTHNGTIHNMDKLLQKYEVDATGCVIDSHKLAAIIKNRGFEVLNYYDGAAALAMCFFKRDPSEVFLFHGSTKDKPGSTSLTEERPLYYIETPEGLYYSSMANSLLFIGDGKYMPIVLPHNKVFRVADGELKECVYEVHRDTANVDPYRTPKEIAEYEARKQKYKKQRTKQEGKVVTMGLFTSEDALITRETMPLEMNGVDMVYFRFGRFWRSDRVLLNGTYRIDRDGRIIVGSEESKRYVETFYFIRGVMIQDKASYNKVFELYPDICTTTDENIAFKLSKYSKYPTTTLYGESITVAMNLHKLWFDRGKKAENNFKPKFSCRYYDLKEGLLHHIVKAYKDEEVFLKESHNPLARLGYRIDGIDQQVLPSPPEPVVVTGFSAQEQQPTLFADLLPVKLSCERDEKWVPNENGSLFDKCHNLITDDSTDVDVNALLEEIQMNVMVANIKQWADKVIKRSDVTKMPETFLMVLDDIILKVFEKEKGVSNISDKMLEQHTTDYLNDMILTGYTLHDTLDHEKNYITFLSDNSIKACFDAYAMDELQTLINRYNFIDFIPNEYEDSVEERASQNPDNLKNNNFKETYVKLKGITVYDEPPFPEDSETGDEEEGLEPSAVDAVNAKNETRERIKLMFDQLKSLIRTADSFQHIDNTGAQDIAFNMYRNIDEMKKNLDQTIRDYDFTDLLDEMAKIK